MSLCLLMSLYGRVLPCYCVPNITILRYPATVLLMLLYDLALPFLVMLLYGMV